jgi:dihydroorotase
MDADRSEGVSVRPLIRAGREFLEVRDGDEVSVIERYCPHQGADLLSGSVVDGAIKCPRHGYLFDLVTGEGINCRFALGAVESVSGDLPSGSRSEPTAPAVAVRLPVSTPEGDWTREGTGRGEHQLDLVLRGGELIDPSGPRQGAVDIGVADGRIVTVDPVLGRLRGAQEIDLAGRYLAPGFVDIHVHGFGALGFADIDTVGVASGCTTVCDAGGAGAYSLDELAAQLAGTATRLRSWLYIGPAGISVSLVGQAQGSDMRGIIPELPVARLFELVERHGDLLAGIKVPAFGPTGERGPMLMAKGLAVSLGLPLYVHVGDIQQQQPPPLDVAAVLDVLDAGDIVTHCYSPNPNGLVNGYGKLLPCVNDALARGVHFDVGMGAFNFDVAVARRCIDDGFVASTISSDLQQANVTGPTWSLTHVASMFLALGLSLSEVVERITTNAADRIGVADDAGVVLPGRTADLTVFDVEDGEVEFFDTCGTRFTGSQEIAARLTIRAGKPSLVDTAPARQRSNWSQWASCRAVEEVDGSGLGEAARGCVERLAAAFEVLDPWEPMAVHQCYEDVLARSGASRAEAARAVLGAFLDPVFAQSPPFMMATQDRSEVVDRLRRRCRVGR